MSKYKKPTSADRMVILVYLGGAIAAIFYIFDLYDLFFKQNLQIKLQKFIVNFKVKAYNKSKK